MGIEIVEAFRKAMIDVLVPEIRELRNEMSAFRKDGSFAAVQSDIKVILARMDVAERVARIEAILGVGVPEHTKTTQPQSPPKPRRRGGSRSA